MIDEQYSAFDEDGEPLENNYNRITSAWKLRWDYNGWDGHASPSPWTQSAWNQTLITKINQLSAQINQASMRGGANEIRVNEIMHNFLQKMEYASMDDKGYRLGRFSVVLDETLEMNVVVVRHANYPMEPFKVDNPLAVEHSFTVCHEDSEFIDSIIGRVVVVTDDKLVGEVWIDSLDDYIYPH